MLLPYKCTNQGDSYTFITDKNLKYIVTFTDLSDKLNTQGKYQVVDFSFFCENEPQKLIHDPRISITLLDLLQKFFAVNKYVLLFVCDTSDGKGRCRKITFNKWVKGNDHISQVATKYDKEFKDMGVDYCSLIVGNNHPLHDEIVNDFNSGDLFFKRDK